MELPLFLLNAVLHSGGRMELRVFETRYMDMVKECLRSGAPFGVCLIARGSEVAHPAGSTAEPRAIGTLANIADWQMPQLGILHIVTHGGQRFRILAWRREPSGLVRARVVLLPDPPVTPIPADYARLVPMLRTLIEALEDQPPRPHRFYDAAWVADRWAELLPLPMDKRQEMLELDDGVERLDVIYRFLEEN
ncbi:MAG: LON peptidase substrate-binding domain-containing protein [Rhodocyclaceae bacterium]